jgi:hypothetical protein
VHLPQSALTGAALWQRLLSLAGDRLRLETGRAAALRIARPEAAREIAAHLERLLPPPRGGARGPAPARTGGDA